jgi:hypothetical protein
MEELGLATQPTLDAVIHSEIYGAVTTLLFFAGRYSRTPVLP